MDEEETQAQRRGQVMLEAETRVMQPQAKEPRGPPGAERGRKGPPLEASQVGGSGLPASKL